ncbi:jhy protein homolog isoform X1 [Monodelphis domestica]|uniref:Junctional cadherin complex regulator n=1 Tax=Monodelphis domestica TaxID=13616 RepID=F7DC56_MONDO|nr:jhy protein homolog isoform X1 [Monodelphis domestica]
MNTIKPVPKFSIHPPVHHTNLKVRSNEPPLNKDSHEVFLDSLETDSEIPIQEIKYRPDLQKENQDHEALMKEVFEEMEPDSLDEESPKFENLIKSEEASNEIVKLSKEKHAHPEVPVENKSQQLLVDKYSDLRYDPNWKNNKEEEISNLKRSQQTEESFIQSFSWDPVSYSKETSFELSREKSDLDKRTQSSGTLIGSEFLSSNYERDDPNSESVSFLSSNDTEDKSANLSEYVKSSSSHNDVFLPLPRSRRRKSKQDIVEKNKVTLGLSVPNTGSYLYQHNKKMGGIHPEKISKAVKETEVMPNITEEAKNPVTNPDDKWHHRTQLLQDYQEQSQTEKTKFTQMPNQLTSETSDVRLTSRRKNIRKVRKQYKLWSGPKPPNSHIKPNIPKQLDVSQGNQKSMPKGQYKQIKPADPSTNLEKGINMNEPVNHLQDLNAFRHQYHKEESTNFALPKQSFNKPTYKNPAVFNSILHINEEKGHQRFQESSSLIYRFNTQPDWDFNYIKRSSKGRKKGSKSTSDVDNQGSFEKKASPLRQPNQTYSESSYTNIDLLWKFHPQSESEPARISPDTQLTHIMEQHQQALMQLTEVQPSEVTSSNTMFPSIFSRVDSESQLNTGKSQRSQATLSRCNSEGYLLQLEKQKKNKDRAASKTYKLKGFQKKDVKLGGLGPDFESIKDKIKKLKQQKEYAKQVQEYNMKTLSSGSKPQTAKPENKTSISRQKALEYARNIPKPKLVLPSNQNDQESKEKRNPSSEKERNLPEISLLEILQSRHEREKQAVAAFKVLHIV